MVTRGLVCLLVSLHALALTLSAENVLLISVDTLRADRLSCYGYRENRTEMIDLLAEEGVLFEQAYSEYPLTLPAHASILTGKFPFEHGVKENLGFVLKPEETTLAEILHESGFLCAGFIGAYVMASEFGLAQGFDFYDDEFPSSPDDDPSSTSIQRTAQEVTDRFLEWMGMEKPQRFFAFLHFYDPHMPRPFGYDHEVTQVNQNLGRIYRFLSDHGLLETTHIVLTADHGEGLGEHGESGHGFFLYDSTIHIPLIIRPAGGTLHPSRIAEPVSLVDVFPTILEILRLKAPPTLRGRSLVPLFRSDDFRPGPVYAETEIPNLHFGWAMIRSIRDGRFKYIDAPEPELYDLLQDPHELNNLYPVAQDTAAGFRVALTNFVKTDLPSSATERGQNRIDPQTLKRLSALGYVHPGGREESSFIDPKARIEVFEGYHNILNLLAERKVSVQTLERIHQLQEKAPEIRSYPFLRAWVYEVLGDFEQALADYRNALQQDPNHLPARGRYARALAKLGKLGLAEQQFRVLLRAAPEDYGSRNNLAGILHRTGRTVEARMELERLTSQHPDYVAGWQNLGQLYLETADWLKAESAFRNLIDRTPRNPQGYLLLARALEGQGRRQEAKAEAAKAQDLQ